MTTVNPPNIVEMIRKPGGGWQVLLDGYDLAPHISDWQIGPEGSASEGPVLTVQIPTSQLVMRSGDTEAPEGYRYVQRPSDKEPRLVKVGER